MNHKYLFAILVFGAITVASLPAEEREFNIHSLNLFTPTNRSFKVILNDIPVFLRIGRSHPEEVGIDRAREIRYLKIGEKLGLTPALLGYELDNGLLMTEFIEGSTPSPERMHDLSFLRQVVANLHTLHAYQIDDNGVEKTTFDACRHFYHSITALNIPYDEERVSYWMSVINSFEEGYYEGFSKAVCHGDIYHGNLLESLDGKVFLIDWEYAFYGYVIDDLGKLGTDDMTDAELHSIVQCYWGTDSPEMFLKLKQNVFMHELVHYFWCLINAEKNPSNAVQYHKRARLMRENLNRAASFFEIQG